MSKRLAPAATRSLSPMLCSGFLDARRARTRPLCIGGATFSKDLSDSMFQKSATFLWLCPSIQEA